MIYSTVKRILANPLVILSGVTLLCLVPFVNKAFHIDDTLFLAAAKQIQSNPANFYGFNINWYGIVEPMSDITKNPPLTCYYIAMVTKLFGWSEVALHLAFLIPALAASLGSFYLAKQLCSRPMLAVMAGVLTPAFVVSSTNVMCDTMMLAFWVWAVACWVWGMEKNKWSGLLIGAVLIAPCALTKYFGISLILLLFIYSVAKKRKIGTWVLYLLIPVVILALYQWTTFRLYGRGLLTDAASYASTKRWNFNPGLELLWGGLLGLAFTGGGITTVLFYAPLLWSRRILISGAALMVVLVFSLGLVGEISNVIVRLGNRVRWDLLLQFGLMSLGGVYIIWIAAADLYKCRDCKSLLLFLWVLGTFVFASFVNWTVNGRSILPMVPAVGILLGRRIDRINRQGKTARRMAGWRVSWPLIPAVIIALFVCWADYTLAGTARDAVKKIYKMYENRQPTTIWFQGHWGFQYYMEARDAKAQDFNDSKLVTGDVIVVPMNNTDLKPLSVDKMFLVEVFEFMPCRWLSTMDPLLGAGFYVGIKRPLPFSFGRVSAEKYGIFVVK
ncbi:MAG: glycosyltransferase family 39 protein [Phycisphaerae bacterium]|nr:glycosyltransferase family 39 protein [Phycisphaerae bacterium]MDD5381679.1 glycosyltransferase family 39 protein [Phycisphaerae bacterium]